ncbi:hypothetical protein MNBD_GAMMA12-3070 [hydrothermal vent metagenome]|uniref:Uncharacterized protein n=1 Tax=hydrothermal vent metagenome TaxID=652676 RepID=A0A3B0YGF6_9ZZZZ
MLAGLACLWVQLVLISAIIGILVYGAIVLTLFYKKKYSHNNYYYCSIIVSIAFLLPIIMIQLYEFKCTSYLEYKITVSIYTLLWAAITLIPIKQHYKTNRL